MIVRCHRWITALRNWSNVSGLLARRDFHLGQRDKEVSMGAIESAVDSSI